ncbi:MAG: succinyl-diaminopimelate desuccinylase [Parvularculaceae bacterium]
MSEIDPVELARALIRHPSVTPADARALDALEDAFAAIGFACTRLRFEGDGEAPVDNLFARFGEGRPHFCYAGHADTVPAGDEADWSAPPFEGIVRDGSLWGRGAADMKGALAAFAAAAERAISAGAVKGSLSLLITGDEEGPAINGTRKMLAWLRDEGDTIDHCLVGEPTNPVAMGDMVKAGRRGSLNCWLTVEGRQGHVAYPDAAQNPIPALMRKLLVLSETPLDDGYARFQPSSIQVTDIHIGNPAHNVIPARATARFNVRFNPNWNGATLDAWLTDKLDALAEQLGVRYTLKTVLSGEAFLTTDDRFLNLVADAVKARTGRTPEFSTSGGTSDARFIKDYAPVVEFGLVSATIHQIDEHAAVADIQALADIYQGVLERYFTAFGGAS